MAGLSRLEAKSAKPGLSFICGVGSLEPLHGFGDKVVYMKGVCVG